ncbi:MAG: DegT/DnrJ/EryC1/StrS family aminotransferase [Pseudomonadota bacterium]
MSVPFIDLKSQYRALQEEIDGGIRRVLEHGQFIMGPEVAEMEQALAALTGAGHCISVASGTEAMLIALMALGIGRGDEVIVPAFTFAATAEVVLRVGATPVLVDVEADTCNIQVEAVRAAITERTRAIIPVSLYGQPADMDELNATAESRAITVIEDAAQSFGSTYRDRKSCALSRIGCTSFFPSKPLGCYGDGGAIFTDDADIAQAGREIRIHGQSGRYHHTRVGVGGRMDTLQCAVILAKLKRFDWEIERRIAIGERYNRLFDERGIARAIQRPDRNSVFAQYTIMVPDRPRVAGILQASGIPTAVHYPAALNAQPAYAETCVSGPLPVSGQLAQSVLSVPMHPDLDQALQDRVVEAVEQALRTNQAS